MIPAYTALISLVDLLNSKENKIPERESKDCQFGFFLSEAAQTAQIK